MAASLVSGLLTVQQVAKRYGIGRRTVWRWEATGRIPRSLVLLVSRSLRQSTELFRYVKQGYRALERPVPAVKDNECQLELANGSRLVALPGREETVRSFQGVSLLILDEAARVPDTLFSSLSPMTGVSGGRTICLSTP